ncbi:uncharacterized protein AKAME5_002807600, partial [Lates japonicus]
TSGSVTTPVPVLAATTASSTSGPCPRRTLACRLATIIANGAAGGVGDNPQNPLSMAWLDSVNREREQRGKRPGWRSAVSSRSGGVFRVPWDLVYHIHQRPDCLKGSKGVLCGMETCLSSESPPAQSEVRLSTGPSRTQPEEPAPTVPVELTQSSQSTQSSRSSFYSVSSGALPGTRDRSGRALLTVCTWNSVWSNPDCDRPELLRLLLYYTSALRKEVRALGLTVLVDARRAAPVPALFSALRSLQENTPGSIHAVLLLVNKDSSLRLDKPAAPQVEVLSSLKSVQKHVELQQLPAEFGGSLSFSQSSWISFRSRVEQLTNQCEDVINLLQKTINILQSTPLPAAAEDAELLLSRYKAVMRSILEDGRLVRLQQEGGASLSRLRREESGISMTEEYRVEVETVSSLYDQVDELLHRLVTLSNSRTQELNFILDFRNLEQGFTE